MGKRINKETMKNLIIYFCVFIAAFVVSACLVIYFQGYKGPAYLQHIENEQMKEDIRILLNDMDNCGDLEKYAGREHVERLYRYSHNLED